MTVTDASLRRAGLMRYAQDSDGKEIPDACFVRPLNQGANPDNVPIAQFSKACLQAILGVDGSHVLDAADLGHLGGRSMARPSAVSRFAAKPSDVKE